MAHSAQTTLSVRMDADIKRQLDELCAEVGMTTSTAVNMFARAFIRERELPFRVKADPCESAAAYAPACAPASVYTLGEACVGTSESRVGTSAASVTPSVARVGTSAASVTPSVARVGTSAASVTPSVARVGTSDPIQR